MEVKTRNKIRSFALSSIDGKFYSKNDTSN